MEGVVSWADHIQAILSQRPIQQSMKLLVPKVPKNTTFVILGDFQSPNLMTV